MCVNGSTAAAHDNASTIYVYRPPEAVVKAMQRWAAYLYRQRDNGVFETTIIPDSGVVVTPEGMPQRVRDLVNKLRKRRRYVR